MFGYDSAEDYFDYQDQIARENAERARIENELEAEAVRAEEEELALQAQIAQYEEDRMHYLDEIDF